MSRMLNFRTIFSHEPDSDMVLNHDLMVLFALIDSGDTLEMMLPQSCYRFNWIPNFFGAFFSHFAKSKIANY